MLEFLDLKIDGVVAYRLAGKISTQEMKEVLDLFRQIIDRGEKINLYQEVTSLGGVELEAMVEKLKFFLELGVSHFGRVAVVPRKKWIPKLVDLEGKLFKNVEMKRFALEEKDLALAFLKGE
ncbi:MAG: STAS/SEC14 domain-containing protein [Desulfobacter sp.]|nr:STAS/SEC14 domain-containing protein [Desulfobacter sp.]WDP86544.1 MAG: STAS/SEC14 domain-containing protein [Desulfobacter sp.]